MKVKTSPLTETELYPESCSGKRKQLSESVKDLVLSPSLTSDYVSITVGDGLTPEYDLSYSGEFDRGITIDLIFDTSLLI